MSNLLEQNLPYVRLNGGTVTVKPITANQYLSPVVPLSTAATVTLDPTVGSVFTLTPTQNMTINAGSAPAGQEVSLVVTTSGTSSFTLTFGTKHKSQGTIATGTVSGKVFVVAFVSDGVNLNEVSRTTAM